MNNIYINDNNKKCHQKVALFVEKYIIVVYSHDKKERRCYLYLIIMKQ